MTCNSISVAVGIAITAIFSTPALAAVSAADAFYAALKIDAIQYAKANHLSNEEGFQRLKWRAAASDVVEGLREEYRDQLADLCLEHAPMPRVVIAIDANMAELKKMFPELQM